MSENNNKSKESIEALDDSLNENVIDDNPNSEIKQVIEQLKKLSQDEIIELAIKQQQAYLENQEKIAELTSLVKRVQADFDNYRKRNAENITRVRQDASAEVVEKFLPTLDIIDQALLMIKDEQVSGGIKMMRKQLMDVFGSYGVSEIEALEADFNPNLHEAVLSEENAEKSGKVLEVLRKGYKMGERVLRYTAVKVAN